MKKIICYFFIFFNFFELNAQNLLVDKDTILIGQQIRLTITNNLESTTTWPDFSDTIVAGLEIINITKIDTTDQLINQQILFTAWDSGTYFIPPVQFSKDQISQSLTIYVASPKIDLSSKIKDIKSPIKEPIGWNDIWPIILILLLLLILFLLLKKYFFKKKNKVEKTVKKVNIPNHIIALKALRNLNQKKLWQKGKTKEYHSQISEIIRRYIENRFKFIALELTTKEIIQNLKSVIKKEETKNLQKLLERADLVKFAKSPATENENIDSIESAIKFVELTKEKDQNE